MKFFIPKDPKFRMCTMFFSHRRLESTVAAKKSCEDHGKEPREKQRDDRGEMRRENRCEKRQEKQREAPEQLFAWSDDASHNTDSPI